LILRQSTLKKWQECPLKVRFEHIDKLRRLQSGSLTFGSIIHHCVQWMEEHRDLDGALELFNYLWYHPTALDDPTQTYAIDYYVKGTNWIKFMEEGKRILTEWWHIFEWDSDLVLAREYEFDVPIGDGHTLHGTIDKLKVVYRADIDQWVLRIDDYKTNKKRPTYDYLAEDLQFTAYGYATLQPEFWANLPGGRGMELMAQFADYPRYGQWIALTGPMQLEAGPREERHYNRLIMACNAMAESIAMRIFVPNISGEACRYCEFRKQCGLPELIEPEDWWAA